MSAGSSLGSVMHNAEHNELGVTSTACSARKPSSASVKAYFMDDRTDLIGRQEMRRNGLKANAKIWQ